VRMAYIAALALVRCIIRRRLAWARIGDRRRIECQRKGPACANELADE